MATEIKEKANDDFDGITICTLCSKSFIDSRMLPCMHTFCLSCLEQWVNSNQTPEDKRKCPICRQVFDIPAGGFCSLRKNYFVNRLLESEKIFSISDSLCSVCSEEMFFSMSDEIHKSAKFYCVECQGKLCEACMNDHKRQKLLKSHNIMTIGDIASRKQLLSGNALPSLCNVHSHEVMKMYCTSCEQVICMKCFVESHQSHSFVDISRSVGEFKQSLIDVVDSIKSVKKQEESLKAKLETEKSDIIEKLKLSRAAVTKRSEMLKEVIDKQTSSLYEELDSVERKWNKDVETVEKEVSETMKVLDIYLSYLTALQENGSPSDVCQSVKGLKTAVEMFLKDNKKFFEPELAPVSATFVVTNTDWYEQNNGNFIGRLTSTGQGKNVSGGMFRFGDGSIGSDGQKPVTSSNFLLGKNVFSGISNLGVGVVGSDGTKSSATNLFNKPTLPLTGGKKNTCQPIFRGTGDQSFGTGGFAFGVPAGIAKKNAADASTSCTDAVSKDDSKIIVVTENLSKKLLKEKRTEIKLVSLKLLKTFEPIDSICGAVFLQGFVYVLTRTCIFAYTRYVASFEHAKTIVLPPEIEIKDKETGNIAASENNGCFYLYCGSDVWKFTAEDDKAMIWLSTQRQVTSISTSQDKKVLIGTSERAAQSNEFNQSGFTTVVARATIEQKSGAMLQLFTPDAKVNKQFLLPTERGSLRQAFTVSSGNIVMTFNKGHEVFEMNLEGVIIRCYDLPNTCNRTDDKYTRGLFGAPSLQVTHSMQRSACIAENGTGCLYIGYGSHNCKNCPSKLVRISSDFQLEQDILPNLHYGCENFHHIVFNQNHSQLLTICGGNQEAANNKAVIKVFNIYNA